jgi:hypothetical protein
VRPTLPPKSSALRTGMPRTSFLLHFLKSTESVRLIAGLTDREPATVTMAAAWSVT